MTKFVDVLLAALVIFGITSISSATVITFEDLYTYSEEQIPNGYGGFSWNAMTQIRVVDGPKSHPGTGYAYGSVSWDMVAYNFFGQSPSEITHAGPGTFTFISAYFTSAWDSQEITFAFCLTSFWISDFGLAGLRKRFFSRN